MLNIMEHIETRQEKYPISFTFNVMEKIQEKYGSMTKWEHEILGEKEVIKEDKKGRKIKVWESTDEPNFSALKYCLTESINEGIDIENEENNTNRSFVTEKKVGRIITEIGINQVSKKLFELVEKATDTGENEKN